MNNDHWAVGQAPFMDEAYQPYQAAAPWWQVTAPCWMAMATAIEICSRAQGATLGVPIAADVEIHHAMLDGELVVISG